MNAPRIDVFLSYSSQDQVAVEAVARRLSASGLTVFLDRWYLLPGHPWPRVLEEILDACHSICIFLGPHEWGAGSSGKKLSPSTARHAIPPFRSFLSSCQAPIPPWASFPSTPGKTSAAGWI